MDGVNLSRLLEKQQQSLENCIEKISKWTKFREDYTLLQEKLSSLPDQLSYEVQVPFGSLAFMPGKIHHTNEILVLLGDCWFVERSAKQARDIVARRIASCDETLKELEFERKHFESWLQSTANVRNEIGGQFEIVEEYDEEKEKLWNERHRASLRKHRQSESSDRAVVGSDLEAAGVDDARLSKHDESKCEITEELPDIFIDKKRDEGSKEKTVRFEELEAIDDADERSRRSMLTITFTGARPENADRTTSGDGDLSHAADITSPADIYRLFGESSKAFRQTKSILKPASSSKKSHMPTTMVSDVKPISSSSSSNVVVSMTSEAPFFPEHCTKPVREHDGESSSKAKIIAPRKVSKFKADKMDGKR